MTGTPTPILNATNSMVTVDEAGLFFSGRLWTDAWDVSDSATKQKALVMATRDVDAMTFMGSKADTTQPHAFPRTFTSAPAMDASTYYHPSGMFSEDGIQQYAKDAVCEQALWLLQQTPYEVHRARQMAQGVASTGTGSASESYAPAAVNLARHGRTMSPDAIRILAPVLAVAGDLV